MSLKSEEPDPFTQLELGALVTAAEAITPAWGLLVRSWAQSGMRSGELRGLQWQDFQEQPTPAVSQPTATPAQPVASTA